jgi:hypothetical protein
MVSGAVYLSRFEDVINGEVCSLAAGRLADRGYVGEMIGGFDGPAAHVLTVPTTSAA